MDLGLTGKVVAITGAARGIGAETAAALVREGAAVALLDQDADMARDTAARIAAEGGRAAAFGCDVTRGEDVARAFGEAAKALGPVDVLVNNAGFARDKSILRMEEGDWDGVIAVTLKGCFHCCRAVLPSMRERRWGRIINISSRSVFGNPGQTNYSAAKAGVIGFTRALAVEHAKHGVTVNAVAPGFIETQGMRDIPNYPALREAALAKNPVGFLGEPRDIAATIAFVASEQARYMTGTTLFVTGGRYSS